MVIGVGDGRVGSGVGSDGGSGGGGGGVVEKATGTSSNWRRTVVSIKHDKKH